MLRPPSPSPPPPHTHSATRTRPCHLPAQIEDTTSSYQAAISSLTKQLTEAREVASNNELKAQQRKLVLLQVGADRVWWHMHAPASMSAMRAHIN
jgi:hypothetical protein